MDNPVTTSEDAPKKRRKPRVMNAGTQYLADQLRRDTAGQATDNRLEQSAHYRGVIYVAVRAIMDAVQGCSVRVTKKKKKRDKDKKLGTVAKALVTPQAHQNDEQWVPVSDTDNSLVKLLDRPNRTETVQDLLAYVALQYLLTGSALMWTNRDSIGLPAELYVLPTALCYPQPATTDYPQGWWRVTQYYPSGGFGILPSPVAGGGVPIDGRDVFRFKNPHPLWRWDAYSPLTAGRHQLDILEAVDQARWTAMDSGVTPSMVVSVAGLTEKQCDQVAEKIADRNAGRRNHRKAVVLSGDEGSDAKPDVSFPDTSPKDMDFASGWEQMAGFALSLFGVPKSVASLSGTGSYAELYAALKQFHTLTLGPLVSRLARWLTRCLAHVWGRDFAIEIDPPRIDDLDMLERQISSDASNSAITVNEIRALRNRPLVEGGNVPPKIYEATLTNKMQAQQQQEQQAQQPPGDPSQAGPPQQPQEASDPIAAMGEQTPEPEGPTDPAVAVLSAFGLKSLNAWARVIKGFDPLRHPRLHGHFVSRAEYLAAVSSGEVSGKKSDKGGGKLPTPQPLPQSDPLVEAYQRLRAMGKPVPEAVGRVFGPSLSAVAGKIEGDPNDVAAGVALKRAGDVARYLKVGEAEGRSVLLAAFAELSRQVSQAKGESEGKPQAQDKPEQHAESEEQPPQEQGTSEPKGPPAIPRPKNPAGKGSLPPRMGASQEKSHHKFGCVYLPLPAAVSAKLRELGECIPDEHLADDGREEDGHVTLLFGLHEGVSPDDVKRVLAGSGPVRLRLGAASVFPNKEYDVVKVDVLGIDCPRLHGALCSLPHTQTHPTYIAHATIAYVQSGMGASYARWFGHLDMDCEITQAVFSDSDRRCAVISLGEPKRVEKAMSVLADDMGGALVPAAGSGAGIPLKRGVVLRKRRKRRRSLSAMCKSLLEEIAGSTPNADVSGVVDGLLRELGG